MTVPNDAERLLTKAELAERWQVSEKTVDRHIRRYGLPHIKIGRQTRFSFTDILQHEKKMRK
jgi:excisionase family DNA binding protein